MPTAPDTPAPRPRLLPGLTAIRDQPFWRVALTALVGSALINLFFYGIGWAGPELKFLGLGTSIAFAMWLTMSYTNAYLSARFDWLGRPWRAFLLAFALNVVVAAATLSAVYFVFWVGFEGEAPGHWLRRQRFGDYFGSILIGLLITAIYQGAYFVKLWKESVRESEALQRAGLTAKYEALNAQVNPHFLFNSLNVLSALVRRDPEAAEGFIQGLSEVYRYVLEVRGEQLVPLARELEALGAYAKLVTMRFGGSRLVIDVDLGPRPGETVVPLALQMLVENAVKHNGATRQHPLVIRVYREAGHLVVANNKVRLFEPPESKGIGLDNIRERYRLATGGAVVVEDAPDSFTVKLPL